MLDACRLYFAAMCLVLSKLFLSFLMARLVSGPVKLFFLTSKKSRNFFISSLFFKTIVLTVPLLVHFVFCFYQWCVTFYSQRPIFANGTLKILCLVSPVERGHLLCQNVVVVHLVPPHFCFRCVPFSTKVTFCIFSALWFAIGRCASRLVIWLRNWRFLNLQKYDTSIFMQITRKLHLPALTEHCFQLLAPPPLAVE